jgi:hypothetical protein
MPQVAHLFFFFSPPAAASEGLPTGETLAETPRDPGCVRNDALHISTAHRHLTEFQSGKNKLGVTKFSYISLAQFSGCWLTNVEQMIPSNHLKLVAQQWGLVYSDLVLGP